MGVMKSRPIAATSAEQGGNKDNRSGRLVVVSNRVPIPAGADSPSPGGLAVALDAALKQRGGLWFGWPGPLRGLRAPAHGLGRGHFLAVAH